MRLNRRSFLGKGAVAGVAGLLGLVTRAAVRVKPTPAVAALDEHEHQARRTLDLPAVPRTANQPWIGFGKQTTVGEPYFGASWDTAGSTPKEDIEAMRRRLFSIGSDSGFVSVAPTKHVPWGIALGDAAADEIVNVRLCKRDA